MTQPVSLEPCWKGPHGDIHVDAERARRIRLLRAARNNPTLQAALCEKCRRDPLFWFNNFAWTHNPRKRPQRQPFVPWKYQITLINAILGLTPKDRDSTGQLWPIACDKSRDLGFTLISIGSVFYDWLFHNGADYGLMTRSGTDLDNRTPNSLFGKVDYFLKTTPPWMLPDGFVYEKHRARTQPPVLTNPVTGSYIQGSRTVADAYRGGRLKRVLFDEVASVPRAGEIMESLADATPSPLLGWTPKGRGNYAARLVHGEAGAILPYGADGPDGWRHLRWHYSRHPERDPATPEGQAWRAREQAIRTPEAWRQEQEIDYSASVPGKIFKEFNSVTHVFTQEEWDDAEVMRYVLALPVIEAWDFGSGESLTCVVRAAVCRSTRSMYLLDYRAWQSETYQTIAAHYHATGWRTPEHRVGDPAGKARDSAQQSWISNLARAGVPISARTMRDGHGVRERMRVDMSHDRIQCAPACARRVSSSKAVPTLVESLDQYRCDDTTGKPIKIGESGKYSHMADCVQYIYDVAFPSIVSAFVGQDDLED